MVVSKQVGSPVCCRVTGKVTENLGLVKENLLQELQRPEEVFRTDELLNPTLL